MWIDDRNLENDVLTQLSVIDFLSDLALISNEGAELLNKSGIITKIESILKHGSDSPDGGFLYSCNFNNNFTFMSFLFQQQLSFLAACHTVIPILLTAFRSLSLV